MDGQAGPPAGPEHEAEASVDVVDAPAASDGSADLAALGPPGAAIFSLDRPAAGLYLVAWLLSGIGLGLVFIALVSTSSAKGALAVVGLLLATTGLAAACGYQVVARRAARPATAYRGPSPVLAFLAGAALSLTMAVILGLTGLSAVGTATAFVVGLLVVAIGYLGVIILFVVRSRALSWVEMGWPSGPGRLGRLVGDAAFGLIVTVPFVVPVLIGAALLATVLDVVPTGRIPVVEAGLETLLVVLGAALVAPIGEELFFRGFSLTAWQRDLGPRAALIRSAVFFALVHVANEPEVVNFGDFAKTAVLQVAVILPLGFVLGWVYQRHGIGASIAGHVGYNATLLVLAAAAGQIGSAPG